MRKGTHMSPKFIDILRDMTSHLDCPTGSRISNLGRSFALDVPSAVRLSRFNIARELEGACQVQKRYSLTFVWRQGFEISVP